FPITALREVKMLQKLKHKHITELIEICSSRASVHNRERSTFYLVFSFCEHDLAGLLSNTNVRLSLVHIKTLMKHLLEGLYQIHFAKILHRDMKVNQNIAIRIVLLLCGIVLPELLLGERHYGPQIDMWVRAVLWLNCGHAPQFCKALVQVIPARPEIKLWTVSFIHYFSKPNVNI
uniref:Protein kinase domain-containing protein n=1 Tax=Loa loa TaxID=7209 RepID=A0A1I7VTN9_LOALO